MYCTFSACVFCRLPVHLHEVMMKSRKAEKELSASLKRDPTQAEIADKIGITEQRLHELRKVWPHALTLILNSLQVERSCDVDLQMLLVSSHVCVILGPSSDVVIAHPVVSHWPDQLSCTVMYWHSTVISMSYATAAAHCIAAAYSHRLVNS